MSFLTASVFGDIVQAQRALGEKIAFQDDTRAVRFDDFGRRVDALVQSLLAAGLQPGDRIALLGRNSVSFAEWIATCSAGFIPVPLNWRLSRPELEHLLADCAPAILVADAAWIEAADDMAKGAEFVKLRVAAGASHEGWVDHETLTLPAANPVEVPQVSPDDIACLIYTSGTTSAPKGAEISHRGLVENCRVSATKAIGVTAADKVLCVMPMFHVGGLCYYLLPSFSAGATTLLRPLFDLGDLVSSLAKHAITNVHLVPTMLGDLIGHPEAASASTSLRRIVYAGSAMPVAHLKKAMSVLGDCSFSQSYGSTEGGIISTLTPEDHTAAATEPSKAHRLASCGQPMGASEVRIETVDGELAPTATAGEVLVKSPRTMVGYWQQAAKSQAAFSDGYLRTGDIGYLDGDGYLYLVDRKNDMVVTGGENVFPSEVEQVLHLSPDVSEAAVFGVPDPRWIEKVVAAVVLRPGATTTREELIAFARVHLAAFKCPKEIYLVTDLPKSGAGKVLRKTLRNQFGSSSEPK
ncbi:class I adenylate-forming enzyme family protein [Variovorax sp. LT1R16]|uniref:class I adenylate-forming enzyme family protein n=1 Tax=Variovorax sp. LT1R16 TaxID=3443728 RepID=UPI003F45F817